MPEAYLLFDERGVAQDGMLRHDGVEVDIRAERFVAVLVNRDALGGDDADVHRRLLQALRMMWWARVGRWLVLAVWVLLLADGISRGWRFGAWDGVVVAACALVGFMVMWWAQRRYERRIPLQ